MDSVRVRERQIPLLDLQSQHQRIREEVIAEVVRVIDSQRFVLGENVEKLEQAIAAYCGTEHAIGCASGSDALFLALMALDIRPGDEVLTTPFSFFATAGEISHLGAVPVFADIDEQTFNLDPNRVADILKRRPRIRALIPVHLFGGCADMDPICDLAAEREIPIVEDAAQAIGAEYKGRRAGGLGRAAAFSFYPTKNLGGYGDGGMITTNESALAERLRTLRIHGQMAPYVHSRIGINSRLDALQAAVLRIKFRYLDDWTRQRQRNAEKYRAKLAQLSIPVATATPAPYQSRHVFNQFVIQCSDRDGLRAHLRANGIGTEVYYPVPLHMQPCYESLGYKKGDLPISERLASECLSLPVHPELSDDDIDFVCQSISGFYRKSKS